MLTHRWLGLALAFLGWTLAGDAAVARAAIPGAEEIEHARIRCQCSAELGPASGSTQAIGQDGAGRRFRHGAIYWRESTGAIVVLGEFWSVYAAFDAHEGPLGMPKRRAFEHGDSAGGDRASTMRFDSGAIVKGVGRPAIATYGMTYEVWKKNGENEGPLGHPITMPEITTRDVNLGGRIIKMTSTARQRFEGATLDWSYLRAITGEGWNVQLTPYVVRSRVTIRFTISSRNGTWDSSVVKDFWAHRFGSFTLELNTPRFGVGHTADAEFGLTYELDSRGTLSASDLYFNLFAMTDGSGTFGWDELPFDLTTSLGGSELHSFGNHSFSHSFARIEVKDIRVASAPTRLGDIEL